MTIDEAIVELDSKCGFPSLHPSSDEFKARKLGIKALERVKWHKAQHQVGFYELLPGETEK